MIENLDEQPQRLPADSVPAGQCGSGDHRGFVAILHFLQQPGRRLCLRRVAQEIVDTDQPGTGQDALPADMLVLPLQEAE